MISSTFTVGNFNVKHKDGYYLISENKVSEKGKNYESDTKTFAEFNQAKHYLFKMGVTGSVSGAVLSDSKIDYESKASQAHIAQMEKAKAAKLKKELEK